LEARQLPADLFAVPALHLQVESMYFSPEAARGTRVGKEIAERAAVLFAVEDEQGRLVPAGIALGFPEKEVFVGGLRVRATAGSYPSLLISSVPNPLALWIGSGWCSLGLLGVVGLRRMRTK
jgi:hypothetical protein